jgi:hypothetical protein
MVCMEQPAMPGDTSVSNFRRGEGCLRSFICLLGKSIEAVPGNNLFS